MKISFIGGGNISMGMACYIPKEHEVFIHSSKPDVWNQDVVYIDKVTNEQFIRSIDCVTDQYEVAVKNADIIFVTHPAFMIEKTISQIAPYLKKGAKVGVVPGTGGAEFFAHHILDKGAIFFGMDRVPCVARVKTYGASVIASKKKKTRLAAIPQSKTSEVADIVSDLLDMEIEGLSNYLIVTFTPSNPIVHTSRLYAMLEDCGKDATWKENIPFYAEWDDRASEMLIGCDRELHEICDALEKLDMTGVVPLTKHYEVETVQQLTQKIRSIETMKHILSPMIKEGEEYVIDKQSRYFEEDFPYGLCVIKGFAAICDVKTPFIDEILKWYENYDNVEYFIGDEFIGQDLKTAAIPQNYNITNPDEVYAFYMQ